MRFMMFIYPPAEADKPGARPSADDVAQMMKYNEELAKAGVLLALDGLHPSNTGARISFPGGKPRVTDGPFSESKEIVGGYWMIQCKSREEAIEWAKRVPAGDHFVEVRQVFEMADFPADVRAAAASPVVEAAVGSNHR
jgi:hypothetical protein